MGENRDRSIFLRAISFYFVHALFTWWIGTIGVWDDTLILFHNFIRLFCPVGRDINFKSFYVLLLLLVKLSLQFLFLLQEV